ncbi:cellulose synthase catalytic subunit [Synechococcus sp. CCY9201]|uniref:glycosyltransferase family 2 protein n=1 Tax=Synechococcus sp. CCY9201 TaxID=174697 RepID=UPI002B212847|nr:cellulose synthase catalytic subunit [Synechococcus sp. CCY9201]MEA5473094.1 cellulose synthase catalytic subunit [Synechococcus sp. CCY9201]
MRLPWAVALLTVLAARYLIWRCGSTLNLSSPLSTGLSLLLLAAELLLLATTFLQLWFTLIPPPPVTATVAAAAARLEGRMTQHALASAADRRDTPVAVPCIQTARQTESDPPSVLHLCDEESAVASLSANPLLRVDVFVPTYGEPLGLVERCLRGCLAMDYPIKTVWLLDDAACPELELLCRRLGCLYLSRGERLHAKAGNLNHALLHSSGDLVAVFDADVVPLNGFLRRTVGLFDDSSVGFVQTPQSYMNADPVVRNASMERWLLPDEETFYRWIEPTRQALGAVVCAGTSFVMRRSALEQVGGFVTATSSEDLATGIQIAAAGYRNIFVAEKLSAGLAPLTAAAMTRQRCRWASGTLQILRTGASPFRIRGLTPLQRLAYLEGILHWFNVLPQLLLLLFPLSLGLLGVAPIRLTAAGLFSEALPFFLAQMLLSRWLSGHARTALLPELYRWLFVVPLAGAVLSTLFGRPLRFHVTPKQRPWGRRLGPSRQLLLPLLFLLSLQLIALVHLLNGPLTGPELAALDPLPPATRVVTMVWACTNLLLLLLAVRCCWDRSADSDLPWFRLEPKPLIRLTPIQEGAPLPPLSLSVMAISEEGIELEAPAQSSPAAESCITSSDVVWTVEGLPGLDSVPLELLESPLLISSLGDRRRDGWRLAGRWGALSPQQRDQLQTLLYRRDRLWPQRTAPFELLALPAVLRLLLRPCGPDTWFQRSLIPQRSWAEDLPGTARDRRVS